MGRRKKYHYIRLQNLEKARKARIQGTHEAIDEDCSKQAQEASTILEPEYLENPVSLARIEQSAIEVVVENTSGDTSNPDLVPNPTGRLLPPSAYLDLGGYDPTKPFPNALIPVDTAREALEKLDTMFDLLAVDGDNSEIAKLNPSSRRNAEAMRECLRLYCEPGPKRTFTEASIVAAAEANRTVWYARNVRRFVRTFIDTGSLPNTRYGVRHGSSTVEDVEKCYV